MRVPSRVVSLPGDLRAPVDRLPRARAPHRAGRRSGARRDRRRPAHAVVVSRRSCRAPTRPTSSIVGAPPNKNGTLLGEHRAPAAASSTSRATPCRSRARSHPNGAPTPAALSEIPLGSIDGLGFDQDRLTAVARPASPIRRAPTRSTSPSAAARALRRARRATGSGSACSPARQAQLPAFGTAKVQPRRRMTVTVVGIVKFNNNIVQDDVDANGEAGGNIIFTPAFTRPITQCCNTDLFSGFQLDGRRAAVSDGRGRDRAGDAEGLRLLRARHVGVRSAGRTRDQARSRSRSACSARSRRSRRCCIAGQVIGRQLRLDTDDLDTLRAIGAEPGDDDGRRAHRRDRRGRRRIACSRRRSRSALSPLAPIGPARAVYPSRGIAFDWTVLGVGLVTLIVILSAVAIAARRAARAAPCRRRATRRSPRIERSRAARPRAGAPGRDGRRDPVRARVGTRSRRRAGAIRDARRRARDRRRDRHAHVRREPAHARVAPRALRVELERRDPDQRRRRRHPVADGARAARSRPRRRRVERRLLRLAADRRPDRADHRRPARRAASSRRSSPDTGSRRPIRSCSAGRRSPSSTSASATPSRRATATSSPTRLRIVGTATMPAVGPAEQLHLSMGTGALVAYQQLPYQVRNSGEQHAPDQRVRAERDLRAAATPARTRRPRSRSLRRRGRGQERRDVSVVSVQRPAEIVNYRSMGSTPALLGAALAAGAVVGARAHPHGVGSPAPARPRAAQGARLHPPPARGRRRVAVDDRGRRRRRHRRTRSASSSVVRCGISSRTSCTS